MFNLNVYVMSECERFNVKSPTQVFELDGLLNVIHSLESENLLSERESLIIARCVGVYRELMVINEDLKK